MRKEAADIRKLKKYKPTRFMAEGSAYNRDLADLAVSFIGCLKHTKGEWYGQNFELIDWQEQIIRDLFGIVKPNGYRQFNTAYIEIAKKQGKSELAAAVALLLTCGDMEYGGEVYGCASDRQQASIVFDVACGMVSASWRMGRLPLTRRFLGITGAGIAAPVPRAPAIIPTSLLKFARMA